MSLYIASLNSGSNGNCYYIGNSNEAVLIDAGISCREIEKRMKRLGLNMQMVKGVFITHEHSDHIKGVPGIVKKYKLPVYITTTTLMNAGRINRHDAVPIVLHQPVDVGAISLLPFAKFHDAAEPCSFVVSCNGVRVGVFTDIGQPCKYLKEHFKSCNAAFLEANYDTEMLSNGNYPYHLKKRITGGFGHLSNHQALDVFVSHRAPHLTHLFLAHLSKNNNCPKLVHSLFSSHAGGVQVIVASRFEETPVYYIEERHGATIAKKQMKFSQLALSF